MWAITNTASLNTATPALGITSRLTNSETYVFPPKSDQKAGDIPLGECINNTTSRRRRSGPAAGRSSSIDEPAHNEVESTPGLATTPACSRRGTSTARSGVPPTPRSGWTAS